MLLEKIGMPAMLEQTAEECVEFAHACLKLARYYRGENKVYGKSEDELIDSFYEELADLCICTGELWNGYDDFYEKYSYWANNKTLRLCKRLEDWKNDKPLPKAYKADKREQIEYTSDNGYKGVLYGERSFAIYEVESGKCRLHTGFRNINTYDELVKQVEDFPRFIEWLGTATDDLIDREGVEDEEDI